MSKLYFITQEKSMFSTYTDKTLVIGTPYKHKLHKLKNIIDSYKKTNDKWLNRCVQFYELEKSNVIKLSFYSNDAHCKNDSTYISQLDSKNDEDLDVINQIYQFANCDIFVMYNFDLQSKEQQYILSLQGIRLKSIHEEKYDFKKFFDKVYDMNDMNDNYDI